jgi:hypothetical protein
MEKPYNPADENCVTMPFPSCQDLRGRQSVRATFRLTEMSIHTLSAVATHLGIKQKSLFDHLIEDEQSLNLIANQIRIDQFDKLERIQKTFVLSRRTMAKLLEAAAQFKAPRDALVEYSIQRLAPIISEEREKHNQRKAIEGEIREYLNLGENLLKKSTILLGEDDPVVDRFRAAVVACRNCQRDIWNFVEKGKILDAF